MALAFALAWLCAWPSARANPRRLAPDAPTAVVAPSEPSSNGAPSGPGQLIRGPLAVHAVDVALTIYRAGESRPDGGRVRRDAAWVAGIATYTLERPARAGERITLLDFAGAMREEPRGLDEVAQANYVDGPFDPGGLTLEQTWGADAVQRAGQGDWPARNG